MEYQETLNEEEKQLLDLYRRATTDTRRFVIYGMEAVENLKEYAEAQNILQRWKSLPTIDSDK